MRTSLSLLSSLALATASAHAAIIVSYAEVPGQYNSTLQNTSVIDFNSATTGYQESLVWSGVGTYSPVTVNAADVYGGAGNPDGSNYLVQGANGPSATTLTLSNPVSYFGLWWSAGDNQNVLEFYSGTNLVARFTTASLLTAITADGGYMGNPATGIFGDGNGTEPYAFVNFFGEDEGVSWDRIVFTNESGSGFESDNHTVRDLTWGGYSGETGPVPGNLVARVEGNTVTLIPEPASAVLGMLGSLTLLLRRRRVSI